MFSKTGGEVFVMVDGEFTGPHYTRNSIIALSLVAFVKAPTVEKACAAVEDGILTVHMKPAKGSVMDAVTKRDFFDADENKGLLEALAKDAVSQEEGAALVARFLHRLAAGGRRLHFVAKPSSIDIGRLTHFLCTAGPPDVILPDFTAICLKTQLHAVQALLGLGWSAFAGILREERLRQGVPAAPTHHPIDDCLTQVSDFLWVDRLLTEKRGFLAPAIAPAFLTPYYHTGRHK